MRLGGDIGKTLPGSTALRVEGSHSPERAPQGGSGFLQSLKKGEVDHSIFSFAKVVSQEPPGRTVVRDNMWASFAVAKEIVKATNNELLGELTRAGENDPIACTMDSLASQSGSPITWKGLLSNDQRRICDFVKESLKKLEKIEVSPSRAQALGTLEKAVRLQLAYLTVGRNLDKQVPREGGFVEGRLEAEKLRAEIGLLHESESLGKKRDISPSKDVDNIVAHLDGAFVMDVPRNAYFINGTLQNQENASGTFKVFAGLFQKENRLDEKTMETVSSILSQKGDALIVISGELQQALGEAGLKMGMPELAVGYKRYSVEKEANGGGFLLKIQSQGIPAQGVPLGHESARLVEDVLNSKGFFDYSLAFRVTPPLKPDASCGIEVLDASFRFRLE